MIASPSRRTRLSTAHAVRNLCSWLMPLALLFTANAYAVPSYSRQTGQECAACHIGAFGPQLTPYGVRFKIGGYTDSDGKGGKVPLSAMVVGSVTHTATEDDSGKLTHADLDEASLFLAGKITSHIGSFTQLTYDGIEHHTALDLVDVRFATTKTIKGKDTVFGVTVNNAPTLTDPFNTLPAWAYPYVSSGRSAGAGGAEFAGIGGLEGAVLGTSGYVFWNDRVYAELGTYRALSPSALAKIGVGRDGSPGILNGSSYWRVAYTDDMRKRAWSAGIFGNNGSLKDRDTGDTTSRFHDLGIDGSYQFLGTRQHVATVNGSYIRERDSVADDTLKELKLNASYHYRNTYGGSVGLFRANAASGANDNSGYILQGDWTPWGKEDSWRAPWANLRLGLQYVGFSKVNDDTGLRQKASDSNSLYFYVWTAF